MTKKLRRANGSVAVAMLVTAGAVGWALKTATLHAQGQTIRCSTAFTAVVAPAGVLPFVPLSSLKAAPNPVLPKDPVTGKATLRGDLADYVANLPAAIQLGKALFWDMQAGSDARTACATCHFHAGTDARLKNQLNPSADGSWNGYIANYAFDLNGFDFPFVFDNSAGSQGVRKALFKGLSKSSGEQTTAVADPVFNVGGVNVRQVTGVNTPPAINAVFNHRNFFNGRAQAEFNGVNPFGNRDTTARVWQIDVKGNLVPIDVHIFNASLASQAVGPVLNTVEMSADGRTFLDVAKKLYGLKPLGLQKVDARDSVLGSVADTTTGKGLKVTYQTLVQTAFQQKWWNTKKSVSINGQSASLSQANFSLFWGLAIMLYEATLVSDDTPIDQYVATRTFDASGNLLSDNPALLDAVLARLQDDYPGFTRARLLNGLDLFEKPVAPPVNGVFQTPPPAGSGVGCNLCHVGAETTSASVQNLAGAGLEPGDTVLKNAGFDLRIERMFMDAPPVPAGTTSLFYDGATYTVIPDTTSIPARVNVYDAGWSNIGVRPTAENPGSTGPTPSAIPSPGRSCSRPFPPRGSSRSRVAAWAARRARRRRPPLRRLRERCSIPTRGGRSSPARSSRTRAATWPAASRRRLSATWN